MVINILAYHFQSMDSKQIVSWFPKSDFPIMGVDSNRVQENRAFHFSASSQEAEIGSLILIHSIFVTFSWIEAQIVGWI